MKLKSEIFEITITGKHYSLLLSDDIVKPFLEKGLKRVKVNASFEDKELSFHGAIQKRNGSYCMMFSKQKQKKLGIYPNDYFQLQFFEDDSKYGVEMPEELDAVLLSDYEAFQLFDSFTDGKKRGIIYKIIGIRNSQKRIDKSILICENLKRGIRDNLDLLKSF